MSNKEPQKPYYAVLDMPPFQSTMEIERDVFDNKLSITIPVTGIGNITINKRSLQDPLGLLPKPPTYKLNFAHIGVLQENIAVYRFEGIKHE